MNSKRKPRARRILLLTIVLLGTALLTSCLRAGYFGCSYSDPDFDLTGVSMSELEFVPIVANQAAYDGGSNDTRLVTDYPPLNLPHSNEWWLKDGESVAVHLTSYTLSLVDHDNDMQTSDCNFCQTCSLPNGGFGTSVTEPIALTVNPASSSSETRAVQFSVSGAQSGVYACRNRFDLARPIFTPTEDGTYTAGAPDYCPPPPGASPLPAPDPVNIKIHLVGPGRSNTAGPFQLTLLSSGTPTRYMFRVDESDNPRTWGMNFSTAVKVSKVEVQRGRFTNDQQFVPDMDDQTPVVITKLLFGPCATGRDPLVCLTDFDNSECLANPCTQLSLDVTPAYLRNDPSQTFDRLAWIVEFNTVPANLTGKDLGIIFTLE